MLSIERCINIREKYAVSLSFKSRYTRHKCSFNNSRKRLKTTLSKYIWELKDRNKDFSSNWEILALRTNKFNLKHGCTPCNIEIHEISKFNLDLALNKRNELFSNCEHFSSFCFK